LPALAARQAAAAARSERALRYFSGDGALESAWPELAGQPLDDPAVLDGILGEITDRASARALDRVAPPAPGLSDDDRTRWQTAKTAALDAEDAADAQTTRLIAGLRTGVGRAPGLGDAAITARLQTLRQARVAATSGLTADDESWARATRAAAEIAQAEAALVRLREAAWRTLTIPGDASLEALVEADRARLEEIASPAHAPPESALPESAPPENDPLVPERGRIVDRLNRALPLLTEAEAAPIRALIEAAETDDLRHGIQSLQRELPALETALQGVPSESSTESVEHWQTAAARAVRAREVTATRVKTLEALSAPDPTDALRTLRLRSARLARSKAELEAALAQRRLERAQRIEELGLAGAEVTEADVEAAHEALDEARRAAEEAANSAADAEASLAAQVSDMTEARVELLESRKKQSEESSADIDSLEERLTTLRDTWTVTLALPPLAKKRAADLAAVYGGMADVVRDTQGLVQRRSDACDTTETASTEALDRFQEPEADLQDRVPEATLSAWRTARTELEEETVTRRNTARAELAAMLRILDKARADRRTLRPSADDKQRQRDATNFYDELTDELLNVPIRARSWWWGLRQDSEHGRTLPGLGDLLKGSAEGLILLVVWGLVRRRVGDWTTTAMHALRQRSTATGSRAPSPGQTLGTWLEVGDPIRLQPALGVALVTLLDLAAALLGFRLLWGPLPPVGAVMIIAAAVKAAQLAPQIANLLLGEPNDRRPSLRRVKIDTRARAAASASLAVGWAVGLRGADWLSTSVLMTDRLSDLVRTMGFVVAALIAGVLLVRWAPTIRAVLSAGEQNRLTGTLTRPSKSAFVQAGQAALGLFIIAQRPMVRFFGQLIERRAGLAWLGAALARQHLKEAEGPPLAPLPSSVLARVRHAADEEPQRPDEFAALNLAFGDWKAEKIRGMIAISSDRGTGKSRMLDQFERSIEDEFAIRRIAPPDQLTDADEALAWLARSMDAAPETWPTGTTAKAEALIQSIGALPRQVILVDDAHNLFLRAVGGFRALRRVLDVMHATADRHLWVCAFHGPAWGFLEGVAEAVNLAVFRRRVSLSPLGADALAFWLENRTRAADLEPDYQDLISDSVLGAEPDRARERARRAFWRLLADEAQGNPRIASGYWLTALREGDTPEQVRVGLFASPQIADLEDLGSRDLFVLTAIVIHDGLTIEHLAEVLNLPAGLCRAGCRRLEGRGLLAGDVRGSHYAITPAWAPAIQRVLRNRQFLHGGK
jgi:hypothetical protein